MRRRDLLLTLGAMPVAAALGPAPATRAASEVPRAWLPSASFQANNRLVKLVDHDCGFVSACNVGAGRIWVAYQTRPDGHVHVKEDVGDHLADIPAPELALLAPFVLASLGAPAPAFDLPGPKQGSVCMLVVGAFVLFYFTGRAEDDPSGPFCVWRLAVPL